VLQASTQLLENKAQHYLEGAMEVLSSLENANVLGHLLAHADIISTDLLAQDAQVYTHYACLACFFKGDITRSALDVHINIHHQQPRPPFIPYTLRPAPYHCNKIPECEESCKVVSCSHPPTSWRDMINRVIQAEANALEEEDRHAHVSNCPHPIIPNYLQKRCFHYGSHGHICAHCPHSKPPLLRL